MTIPSQITNPKGCDARVGHREGKIFKRDVMTDICGEKGFICFNCIDKQKAQAQTLLDEKKETLKFLEVILKDISGFSEQLVRKIYNHKIQELQEEIKVLEGVLK